MLKENYTVTDLLNDGALLNVFDSNHIEIGETFTAEEAVEALANCVKIDCDAILAGGYNDESDVQLMSEMLDAILFLRNDGISKVFKRVSNMGVAEV